MDLQEAERIVFIGYSFPLADFEFRYILSKAIASSDKPPQEKKVRVILYPPNPKSKSKIEEIKWKKKKWRRDLERDRYKNFFGKLLSPPKYMDAIDFIQDQNLFWNW